MYSALLYMWLAFLCIPGQNTHIQEVGDSMKHYLEQTDAVLREVSSSRQGLSGAEAE